MYIDDLLGERVWVDREDCKSFVDNIHTAFPTRSSPKHLVAGLEPSLSIGGGGGKIICRILFTKYSTIESVNIT